ncbi:MAG: endonuclease domain-containing protein [Sphingopyxis sp.]|nr:endonuclease domain-containing protein [Sphingopyxis sp.]
MRNEPTEPEKRLWRHLSNGNLAGFKFRRQTVIGRYICDFSCPSNELIMEVDGDTHDPATDALRDAVLSRQGYTVLRFTNADVMHNMEGVLETILMRARQLPQRRYAPTPTPPLEGRG